MSDDKKVVLYHYPFSPYARRIVWYLQLRGIPYQEVKVSHMMPRPELAAIGVQYRRIPVVAIGKDVYCDTRLILRKLEKLYPEQRLGSSSPVEAGLEELLERWHVEASLFGKASQAMPSSLPVVKDPAFAKDREDFSGRPWNKEALDRQRPEALVYIRSAFDFLEKLLDDGRDWILDGSKKPTLADIQAVWVADWLTTLPGALPPAIVSARIYPKTFSWIQRFEQAVKAARKTAVKPEVLSGSSAKQQILASTFVDSSFRVAKEDPIEGLSEGVWVEVYPTDGGSSQRDRGRLIGLSNDEITVELETGVHLHTPRVGFRVKVSDQSERARL